MNPLLDNFRVEAKNKLLNEFKPHLQNFENTTRFIKNDYQKFRNQTENDLRDLYSMNQGDDDYSNVDYRDIDYDSIYYNNDDYNNQYSQDVLNKYKSKITIHEDDAGNFGNSGGSENFVSLNDKNDFKENLQMGNNENQNYDEIPDTGDLFFDED